jgi:type III secretion protein J
MGGIGRMGGHALESFTPPLSSALGLTPRSSLATLAPLRFSPPQRPPAARWCAAAVAVLLAGCEEVPLLTNAAEGEANRAVAALDRAGVAAHKSGAAAQWTVSVARDDVARAVATLGDESLPRREAPGVAETYASSGLLRGVAEEALRAEHARAGEVARTLGALDGVVEARVHVATPEADALSGDESAARPRASVLLRCSGEVDVPSVQRLVAGAVAGLRPDDVAVVVTRVRAPGRRAAVLATVGPFAVARSSAAALRATLAGLIAAVAAMAGWLVWMEWRRRRPAG